MPNDDQALRTLLDTDALLEAERLTGKSYKEDKTTEGIGFLMHMDLAQQKSAALVNAGDSPFQMDWEPYCVLVERAGFRLLANHERTVDEHDRQMLRHFRVYWHDEGVLLHADSYTMAGHVDRNSASLDFNWKPTSEKFPYMHWSGGWVNGVLEAGVDAREGLLLTLREYREHGAFVLPWVARPLHIKYGLYPKWLEIEDTESQLKADLPPDIYAAVTPAEREAATAMHSAQPA